MEVRCEKRPKDAPGARPFPSNTVWGAPVSFKCSVGRARFLQMQCGARPFPSNAVWSAPVSFKCNVGRARFLQMQCGARPGRARCRFSLLRRSGGGGQPSKAPGARFPLSSMQGGRELASSLVEEPALYPHRHLGGHPGRMSGLPGETDPPAGRSWRHRSARRCTRRCNSGGTFTLCKGPGVLWKALVELLSSLVSTLSSCRVLSVSTRLCCRGCCRRPSVQGAVERAVDAIQWCRHWVAVPPQPGPALARTKTRCTAQLHEPGGLPRVRRPQQRTRHGALLSTDPHRSQVETALHAPRKRPARVCFFWIPRHGAYPPPFRPGVTGHRRGRGAGVARAIGNLWLGWRGRGAGMARACPVTPQAPRTPRPLLRGEASSVRRVTSSTQPHSEPPPHTCVQQSSTECVELYKYLQHCLLFYSNAALIVSSCTQKPMSPHCFCAQYKKRR
eukprot:gene18461-biopygen14488